MRSKLDLQLQKKEPLRIFISYSHCDERHREALCKHLKLFEVNEKIAPVWHDRSINPGEEWEGEIDSALNEAEIILLLVSIDFVNSKYCWDIELERALQRHSAGNAVVVPILVRPVHGIEQTPFQHLNYIPRDKPISQYRPNEKGWIVVVSELEKVINDYSNIIKESAQKYIWWAITFDDSLENFSPDRIKNITIELRIIAVDDSICCVDRSHGSAHLIFQSHPQSYDKIEAIYSSGVLSNRLSETINKLSRPVGARLKIATQRMASYIDPIVFEKFQQPEILTKQLRFPPFVVGIVYSADNPIAPGFNLYSDQHTKLNDQEMMELQGRLGRYLNTFLAIEAKYHYVDLSPTKEYAGLPSPLRITEAGRDLLASDLQLKRVTSQLLHPSGSIGASFWHEVKSQGLLENPYLEKVVRLWVTPSKACLDEKNVDERTIRADITGFSLKVECENEFIGKRKVATITEEKILSIFRDIVLPEVQKQVSAGYAFGLLRQIFSIVIISHWFREKLKKINIGFIDSNNTDPYRVAGIDREIKEIHAQYLSLYNNGDWRYLRKDVDSSSLSASNELIIVGGISAETIRNEINMSQG